MKHYLKFAIALILGIVAISFQSCGGDDKNEPDIPVDYNKVESIIGKWSCQAELKNGKEVSCDQFTVDFNANGTITANYSFSVTRSGSYTFSNGTAVCTFHNTYSEGDVTVTMKFSEYNQGRAKVETTIDYGGSGSESRHAYLFYKISQ
ncbi:hypothetical protein [Muribaculum sp.]|uniref:hypothetical protein n=1 Tax=Muribaculum sp. TaxID=1918611 RepID=UPI00258C2D17|nr:hypothetical protein [Muribaculum sp.]MCX4279334.1 hypothetical protein [Muribaculum sp.]